MKSQVIAPTNIAVVKYWGKQPELEELHVPTKSSLSFTVDSLYAKTTLEATEGKGKVCLELNDESFEEGSREHAYVDSFFKKAFSLYPQLSSYDFYVESETNFPVAAGLASSAAGFAALAKAIQTAFPEMIHSEKEASVLARLGSGSAARSIPEQGGVVVWHRGDLRDHRTSYAESLFPPSHWEEIRLLYVLMEREEKKVKSRAGMRDSVSTNPLYWQWVDHEEKCILPKMVDAIKNKDFETLGRNIMQCSNNLHMICLGTYPPIIYLNRKSFEVIDYVHEFNKQGIRAAYTFDAGPNPIIITTSQYVSELSSHLRSYGDVVEVKQGRGAREV